MRLEMVGWLNPKNFLSPLDIHSLNGMKKSKLLKT